MKIPAMARLQPTKRANYHLFRQVGTRWADIDIYGHANNAAYLEWFDTAVNGWYTEHGVIDPGRSPQIFLVAETGAQYFSEIKFPDLLHIGLRITRLGTSSVTYDLGVFAGETATSNARGRFVHVLTDAKTHKPVPITGTTRKLFETILSDDAV